uniref:Uncharacterized protein n=1 Tax=Romanomermis culicivorax TaxID=13658 RepID=A0A915KDT9_ROMCU
MDTRISVRSGFSDVRVVLSTTATTIWPCSCDFSRQEPGVQKITDGNPQPNRTEISLSFNYVVMIAFRSVGKDKYK